jgi:alpha-beta hydrolase superfamily lysophospholipase
MKINRVCFIFALIVLSHITNASAQVPLWKTMPDIPLMTKADESGLAPVNGIQMYYARFNKGGKDPVLLLHGGFANSGFWAFEVPLLAKTHEVIIADSRGHGRSTMTDKPFTYNLMSSDVLQLLDYLKIKITSIVGWSDGGIIGLILAIHHPERVNKLFTYGTNFNHTGDSSLPMDTAMSARFIGQG